MNNQKRTVILASASPRRTELLKQAGIGHLVIPSTCEEVLPPENCSVSMTIWIFRKEL